MTRVYRRDASGRFAGGSGRLMQRARAAGVRFDRRTTAGAPRLLGDAVYVSSAPKGTLPKSDLMMGVSPRDKTRRTAVAYDSSGRRPRRSKKAAARAAQADGMLVRNEFSRLKRSRRQGTIRRRA